MSDLTLYWCPYTRASRVAWLLEEAGASYDRVLINVRDEAAKADPAFRAASPMGKVPAIRHGDVTVTDSAAIGLYIADAFPEAGLAPAIGHPDRPTYLQWMIFSPGYIEPAMVEAFGQLKPNKLSYGWGDFDHVIEMLRDRIADREWLLGDAFSAADVMVGASVLFMRQFKILPDVEALHLYADRCAARPAYRTADALNQTPMPE